MPNIHHELLIEATVEKVYNAISTEEGLSAWWTPGATGKPERGSIARFPFGAQYFKEMKITELSASRRVKWICIAGADEWIGTTLSFELEPFTSETLLSRHPEMVDQLQQQGHSDTGTLLVFHHDDWRAYTPMYAECNYTWGQFLRSLKLFCETDLGRPWPFQHRMLASLKQ
jgi:uncharacterized protein YndB with AHSA1/START domain